VGIATEAIVRLRTILGHLQRGGAPSATDRLLAAQLGAACAGLIQRRFSA